MSETAIVYHPDYLKHRQISRHPECPERLERTITHFKKTGFLEKIEVIEPEPAPLSDIELVHSKAHIDYIKCLSERGMGKFSIIDSDTYVCSETYNTAVLSSGGVIAAGNAVWNGEKKNCFALVRPPGHHASVNQATGFCYFDNVAVMVKSLQKNQGMKRAVIFDWDAHAPNGTMGNFYDDPSVLNMSIHQDPHSFYPGTGFVEQTGEGAGKGLTINFPLQPGAGDSDFLYFIDEFAIPRIRKFAPDMIVISAGQDSHESDTISQLNVTDEGYATMTKRFMELADEICDGKLVLELEGGYNIETLPKTNKKITETLMGEKVGKEIKLNPLKSTVELLTDLKSHLKASTLWPDAQDYADSDEVEKKNSIN